ncbi:MULTISPECIES: PAS domain S-box protein [unclassified Brevundimonas]|uniref:PAS domain S-box protein n=1 Tax=unclassified Brevundimonas TaxID=2622653 RepID=UPI001FD8339B|nr:MULTISPECIES: PAS domain S-box protein [unclassified Brevundimonas]
MLEAADALVVRVARMPRPSMAGALLIGLSLGSAGVGLRFLLSLYYAEITGFMILLPWVILAALAGGRLAGVAAAITSLAGGWAVVTLQAAGPTSRLGEVATVNFIIVSLFSVLVAGALRRALARLSEAEAARGLSDQQALQTAAQMRAMFEQSSAGIARLDLDGVIQEANQCFAELLGLTPESMVGLRTADVSHPDDVEPTRRMLQEALNGRGGDLEKRYIRPDGQIVWALTSVRAMRDAEGQLTGYLAAAVDITSAKASEAALRESETRFRDIADTAPVLVWVTAEDRSRAFVNQAYVAFDGGTYDHALNRDWREILHPDDQARILEESLAGEASQTPFSMEGRYLRHDGQYRWLRSFSRPRLRDGRVIGFVGVAFDVTEARLAQDRLAESEARFRTVADSAPALIWMSDDAAQLVFANKRFRTFLNVRSERRMSDAWRRMVHPDDEVVFEAAFMRAFEARDRFEALARVNHPVLGLRWLRTEGVPRFDSAGVFQGYVGASLDITETKKAEEDLKRINELLEERVSAALVDKAQAEADLMHAQKMEAVGRLTGGVAHDFNNLLTVVIGALDIILRSDDAAKRQRLGEAALSAARRGERLTHQLLAFSRRQALRPEPTDLNSLIREGEPLLRRAVGEAVEFKLKLKRGGARVSVDAAQFEAALLNLVVNARDALDERGGRVSVQTMACQIRADEVRELPAGDYVCVTVSDDGAGMSADIIGRVFEPFFTTKSVGKGTGLGLSQVYGFARQSGGGVQISSTPGRGTEIRLYLPPLTTRPASEAVAAPAEAAPTRTGGRLLLVEDDPAVASVAADILTSGGWTVTAVESAQAALDRLQRTQFDLMLTDIVMPGGMTGVDLARKASDTWPALRIVLTSGYVGEDVDRALADAPWPFLSKPYSAENLLRVLDLARL